MAGEGRERTIRVTAPRGTTFEYKFTLGSWDREALGPAGTVAPNNRLFLDRDTVAVHEVTEFKRDPRDYIADWRGSGVQGRLLLIPRLRRSATAGAVLDGVNVASLALMAS